MKKYLTILALGMLMACTADDAPILPTPEEQPKGLEAPQLSRSITATDAAIAAFTKEGTRTHLWKLEKDGDTWNWASGTNATLSGWDTLVCVVPYISNLNTTTSYTPSQNATLQWGKLGKEEQHTDGRFYFKSITHRLAQVFVEVDHYHSGDELRIYLATLGDFHALTGGFEDLYNSNKNIRPEKTDSGTYVYQFSIVPQTFRKGENLLRYKDEYSTYYDVYYYEAEEDLVVPANHRLNIRLKWKEDWEFGNRYYTTISVTGITLDQTSLDLNEGQTATLTATVSPSNATDKKVTWTSSDAAVATVDANGKVTAVKMGEAIITATSSNGQTATCTVIVRGEVKGEVENTPTGSGGNTGEIEW